LAALALLPREVPPAAAVYQFILLPVEVALRFEAEPRHIEAWVAVTEVGTDGSAYTVTVAAETFVQPLLLVRV
jgi:hypothetical protein